MDINRIDGIGTATVPKSNTEKTGNNENRPDLENTSTLPNTNLTPETVVAKGQEKLEKEVDEKEIKEKEVDEKKLRLEVEKVNKVVELFQKELKFITHSASKRLMVEVVNSETQEVIKEIPAEEFLDWVGKFHDLLGMMIDTTI